MSEWPHQYLHAALLQYIRSHTANQPPQWRFTQLDGLHDAVARMIQLTPGELCVVSCFIDAQRWYVMSTARVFGIYRGTRFEFSPLEVRRWIWGDFKHEGQLQIEVAEVLLVSGAKITLAYEAGFAAMAPIYYERFWHSRYPTLNPSAEQPE